MHWKLQRLQPILVNRKGPILLHNSAQLHVPQPTLQKVNTLHDKVLPHPPHSPDLLPTENHFLEHLDKFLQGKCFHNQQENASATTTSKKMLLQPQPEHVFPLFGKIILGVGIKRCLEDGCSLFTDPGLQLQHFWPLATPAHFRLAPQSRLTLAIPVTACPEFSGFYTLTDYLSLSLKSEAKGRACQQPILCSVLNGGYSLQFQGLALYLCS